MEHSVSINIQIVNLVKTASAWIASMNTPSLVIFIFPWILSIWSNNDYFLEKQGMNPLLQMMMMSMPGAPKRKIIGSRPPFKKPFNADDEKAEDKG